MNRFSKNERRVLLFTTTGHFLAHSLILIFPSIITPLMGEFKLPFDDVIKISFFMYLFYGLGALPSGFISDKLHPKISLTIYFFGIGTASLLTFFSRTRIQLELSLLMLGSTLSIYHPLGMGLISKSVRKRGKALGFNGVFGSMGIASAPFFAGTVNYLLGWRFVYLILAFPPLFLGVLLIITGFEYSIVEGRARPVQEEKGQPAFARFFILCISISLAGFIYRGQTILLPTHFERNVHFLYNFFRELEFLKLEGTKTLSATLLTSAVYIIGVLGHLIGGKIADTFDLRYSYLFFFLLALPFLIMMYFFKNVPLLLSSAFFILLILGMQPVENSLIARFTPVRWRSTSYGIKFILAFGVSSTVIYPISFFQSRFSLEAPFLLLSFIILLVVLNNTVLITATGKDRVKNEL